MAAVDYDVANDWGSGFVGNMTVAGGEAGLHGWIVEFDASFTISNIWGAEIVSHVGNHYVIRSVAWNADVVAGSSASFGFQAVPGSGGTTATALALQGVDDPAPPVVPALSVGDASIVEGDAGSGQLAFEVTLSQPAAGPVTVRYTTRDGAASAGSDYTARSGTLTFAAGEISKMVHVPVSGDGAVEADETLTLALSSPNGATIADGAAAGTIVDDDAQAPSGDASLDYAVADDWGSGFTAAMTVEATGGALDGWTAEFDASFTITNIWNAEIVSHTGDHYVIRNASYNGQISAGQQVSFGFQATPGSGGTAASGFAINGVPAGGDPTPVAPGLAVADATIAEGDSGTAALAFTVTLSEAANGPVTVDYGTANGTAGAGSDYVGSSGTLTFAPGETSKVIHVRVSGDAVVEGNETVILDLSSPNGATIADGQATGVIMNDDNAGGTAEGWLSTAGNQIVDAEGNPVQIAGVNWFGFESPTLAPHGLWARGYKDMMDQMVDLGFNTIRLPFSSEMLHSTAAPNGIDFARNPDLQGLSALQIMDRIVDYAGQAGLKIILDHHRSDSGAGTSPNGLWYDSQHSEAQWVADWQMLAARYADDPTVIGADLHNEPYNGTWGGGGPNDWAAAAELAGNAIGSANPDWLIFVEGVGTYQGQNYWWGGNLMGVRDRPIELDVAGKLVYSAHDYPNSVYAQPWFQGADFAEHLPEKFDQMWGYIHKEGIAPVFLGEFGTNLTDPKDAPWLEAITSYLSGDFDNDGTSDLVGADKGVSWTFWSWNPNSGDTGGVLADDWTSVNQDKMAYLEPIQFDFDAMPASANTAPAAIATTDAADLQALFEVVNSWDGGFNGDVALHNGGVARTSGWQVEIEMTHEITDIWNAVILSHEGDSYVIGNAAWNGAIASDGEASFGFIAAGPETPTSVYLDLYP